MKLQEYLNFSDEELIKYTPVLATAIKTYFPALAFLKDKYMLVYFMGLEEGLKEEVIMEVACEFERLKKIIIFY